MYYGANVVYVPGYYDGKDEGEAYCTQIRSPYVSFEYTLDYTAPRKCFNLSSDKAQV
jgi:hypothetical protein